MYGGVPSAALAVAERTGAQRSGCETLRSILTGKKENVELALSKLGQWVDQKDDHTAIVLMGNDRTGLWKKTMGLAPAKELIRLLDSVLLDKGVDPAGAGGVDD